MYRALIFIYGKLLQVPLRNEPNIYCLRTFTIKSMIIKTRLLKMNELSLNTLSKLIWIISSYLALLAKCAFGFAPLGPGPGCPLGPADLGPGPFGPGPFGVGP